MDKEVQVILNNYREIMAEDDYDMHDCKGISCGVCIEMYPENAI